MINQNMGKIIDEIRAERNMTRDDLCEDIMSVRNYQRFVSEEVNLSNDKLNSIIDRLNLDYFTLREIYRHRSQDKYSKLHHVYLLMQSNSDQKAYDELKKINFNQIESSYMQLFHSYLKIDLERQLKIVDLESSIIKLKKLIDYPNILEFKVLNFIELNILVILNTHLSKKEDSTIADFLYKFLLDDKLHEKGIMSSFLPALYSSTAQSFGTFLDYQKALDISTKGIKECMKLQLFNSMHQLLFFKAISHQKLGQNEEATNTVKRLYTLLHTLKEPDKDKEYLPLLKRIFENLEISFNDTEGII